MTKEMLSNSLDFVLLKADPFFHALSKVSSNLFERIKSFNIRRSILLVTITPVVSLGATLALTNVLRGEESSQPKNDGVVGVWEDNEFDTDGKIVARFAFTSPDISVPSDQYFISWDNGVTHTAALLQSVDDSGFTILTAVYPVSRTVETGFTVYTGENLVGGTVKSGQVYLFALVSQVIDPQNTAINGQVYKKYDKIYLPAVAR